MKDAVTLWPDSKDEETSLEIEFDALIYRHAGDQTFMDDFFLAAFGHRGQMGGFLLLEKWEGVKRQPEFAQDIRDAVTHLIPGSFF